MISNLNLFIERKIIKKEETKNFKIDDYKNPPKKKILGYRTKEVRKKSSGEKRLVKLALVKDPKKGVKTVATSFWREK